MYPRAKLECLSNYKYVIGVVTGLRWIFLLSKLRLGHGCISTFNALGGAWTTSAPLLVSFQIKLDVGSGLYAEAVFHIILLVMPTLAHLLRRVSPFCLEVFFFVESMIVIDVSNCSTLSPVVCLDYPCADPWNQNAPC